MLLRLIILVILFSSTTLVNVQPSWGNDDVDVEQDEIWADEDAEDWEDDGATYETVVESTRPRMSASSEIVNNKKIDRFHPAGADEVMGMAPGLTIVQHGSEGKGHQIFLRGFDAVHGSDVEVTVDGLSLNEPSHVHGQGYVDLYGIIPEVIKQMEVLKGPFLPHQGNFATAGTINFKLGVTENLRPGMSRVELNHFGRVRAMMLAAPENLNDKSFLAVDGVSNPGFGPDREAWRSAVIGSYQWNLGSGRSIDILTNGQTARFQVPSVARFKDFQKGKMGFYDTYAPAGYGKSDRALMHLVFKADKNDTDLEISTYGMARRFSLESNYTGWLQYQKQGDRKIQKQSVGTAAVRAVVSQKIPISIPLWLKGGLGWRFDGGNQDEHQVTSHGVSWRTNRDQSNFIHQIYGYAGVRLVPFQQMEIYPSVRFDEFAFTVDNHQNAKSESMSLWALSPRVAASFPVNERWTLFADYGRGIRSPEARSVFYKSHENAPNTQYEGGEPSVAQCDAAEVGVEFSFKTVLSASLAGFATWFAHEMFFDHVSNTMLEKNGSRRLGVDAQIGIKPTSWFDIDADFTFVDARFTQSGQPIPGTSRFLASGSLFMGKKTGPRAGLNVIWMGTRDLAHGATADGYLRMNANTGYRFNHVEITMAVNNALNSKYMEGAYHFASWFNQNDRRSAMPIIHYAAGEPFTARLMLTAFF